MVALLRSFGWLLVAACAPAAVDDGRAAEEMVREIEHSVRATAAYTGLDALDPAVVAALRDVPRHEFVPLPLRSRAYENRPLPIGEEQTISQPFIVALMTHLADAGREDRVLEIGTGSGYQAAVLARLVRQVYTIEIIPSLGERACATLERLGIGNVVVRVGDGYAGWPEHAPFDAIVVTAAPEKIPQPLIDQLAVGGRLVVPVGPQGGRQELMLLLKRDDGSLEERSVLPVAFVPFTGEGDRQPDRRSDR